MRNIIWKTLGVFLLVSLTLSGCTELTIYRDDFTLCTNSDPAAHCQKHALQQYKNEAHPDKDYFLGFIEFDDQGQLFQRAQMRAVLDKLNHDAARQDLVIVVFVHGWKHSAQPGDDNIQTFRRVLMQLSEAESVISSQNRVPARKISGVYLGWRGGSVTVPVIKELTFWDRKSTAHKVGHGGVTEVLSRLELVRTTKDAIASPDPSRTQLVVVGHSFGGAVVYSATSQLLMDRFVNTRGPAGVVSDVNGFGNLVVLINPAFEALRFTPLSDMSTERGTYFKSQLPVMAVLTSEADDATKRAFPFGRWFSTLFEIENSISRYNGTTQQTETIEERSANITAVGHFEPYRTHYLRATKAKAVKPAPLSIQDSMRLFLQASQSWETDKPGSKIPFESSLLERTQTSAGRNPYLVVRVDKALIPNHNDIADPRIIEFVKQLILIATQHQETDERQSTRQRLETFVK